MASVVIAVEGVLAEQIEEDTFASAKPLEPGLTIVPLLVARYRVMLATLYLSPDSVEKWLRAHGTNFMHDIIGPGSVPMADTPREIRAAQLAVVRAAGAVAFYVDADPYAAADARMSGVPALLVTPPAPPEHLEFQPPQSWDELIATDKPVEMPAEDSLGGFEA